MRRRHVAVAHGLAGFFLFPAPRVRRGLLKFAEVGDGVGKARYAYTSWGDYYFMEALARELAMPVGWW